MRKKLINILFAFVALFAPLSAIAADFQPGIAAGAIIQNPTVQRIMEVGAWFIIVIFACVLTKNIFTFVTGAGKPNWFSIIGKFLIIFFLYNNAVWVVTEFVNKVIVQTNISDTEMLSESFSKLDVALMSLILGTPEELEQAKQEAKNSILPDAVTDALTEVRRVLSPQTLVVFVFAVLLKGLLTVAMITKILMIDIFWPIFFQLTIIGFVFAVPFASLDGGMDAIKKFAINVVEVAMWPVIYNIAFVLSTNELVRTIDKFVSISSDINSSAKATLGVFAYAARPAVILADIPMVATLAAQLVFVVFLGLLIPMFARMIVRNESVGIAASAVTYSVGQGLLKGAAAIGGMAGMAMMNAGKGISGMTAKGAAEAAAGTTAGATQGTAGRGGSSGDTTPQNTGNAGNTGNTDSGSQSSSKVTGDLGSEGSSVEFNFPGNGQWEVKTTGRAAHGGKAFYNIPNLSKEENQALQNLQKRSSLPEYMKDKAHGDFMKLAAMRHDNYHPKAIDNQIKKINDKWGLNIKTKDGE